MEVKSSRISVIDCLGEIRCKTTRVRRQCPFASWSGTVHPLIEKQQYERQRLTFPSASVVSTCAWCVSLNISSCVPSVRCLWAVTVLHDASDVSSSTTPQPELKVNQRCQHERVAAFPRNLSMVGNPRQHPSASVQEHQTNHVLYTRCRDVVVVSSRILIDIMMSIRDVVICCTCAMRELCFVSRSTRVPQTAIGVCFHSKTFTIRRTTRPLPLAEGHIETSELQILKIDKCFLN